MPLNLYGKPVVRLLVFQWIVGVFDIALEIRATFNGKRTLDHIAFNMTGVGQIDLAGANTAHDMATNGDFIRMQLTRDDRFLSDGQGSRMNVAFNLAIDMDITRGGDRPHNGHVGTDDGWDGSRGRRTPGLLRLR